MELGQKRRESCKRNYYIDSSRVIRKVIIIESLWDPRSICCSVLQCVAVCWSALQCVAVCCSVLQCVAVGFHNRESILPWGALRESRRAASCSLAHCACVLPCMSAILPLWLLSSAPHDVPSLHPCLSPCVSASLCGSASAFLCCAPSPTKSTGAGGTSVSSLPYHMFTWWCVRAWRENVGILERDCSTSEKDRTVGGGGRSDL